MPELPRISGAQAIKVFEKLGFVVVRQRGSHVVLRRSNKGCVVLVHKELAVGTLRSAIKQAGVSLEEFVETHKRDNKRRHLTSLTRRWCAVTLYARQFLTITKLFRYLRIATHILCGVTVVRCLIAIITPSLSRSASSQFNPVLCALTPFFAIIWLFIVPIMREVLQSNDSSLRFSSFARSIGTIQTTWVAPPLFFIVFLWLLTAGKWTI